MCSPSCNLCSSNCTFVPLHFTAMLGLPYVRVSPDTYSFWPLSGRVFENRRFVRVFGPIRKYIRTLPTAKVYGGMRQRKLLSFQHKLSVTSQNAILVQTSCSVVNYQDIFSDKFCAQCEYSKTCQPVCVICIVSIDPRLVTVFLPTYKYAKKGPLFRLRQYGNPKQCDATPQTRLQGSRGGGLTAQPQTSWLDFRDSKGRGQGRERKRWREKGDRREGEEWKGKRKGEGGISCGSDFSSRKNPDMHVLADGKTQE